MTPPVKPRIPVALWFAVMFIVAQDTLAAIGVQGPATVVILMLLALDVLSGIRRERTAFGSRGVAWPSVIFVMWGAVLLAVLNPSVEGLQNLIVWTMFPLVVGTVYAGAQWGTYERVYPWVHKAAIAASLIYIAQVAATGIGSSDPIYTARGAGWLALSALTIVLPRVVLYKESWWTPLLLLSAIVLSQSRTPMAIAVVMIVVAWGLRNAKGKPPTAARFVTRVIATGVLIGSGALWAVQNVPFISERFTVGDGYTVGGVTINSSGRSVLWEMTIQHWLESPWIGHGTGSAQQLITARFPDYISHPHNEYLRILADTGIVGLSLWVLGVLFFAVRVSLALRAARDRESRAIHLAALLSLIMFALGAITDNVTISVHMPLLVGSMIGLSAARRQDVRENPDRVDVDGQQPLFSARKTKPRRVYSPHSSTHFPRRNPAPFDRLH
jgi:O-antigen ligase